jgi:mandelate racemase
MDGVALASHRAAAAAEAGFSAVKTKIGYRELADDLEVVRRIREATDGRVAIMVDYNQSLTVPEAIRRGRALDDEGVAWIEEPTRQDDYAGHARISDVIATPIQMGENWFGPDEMTKALDVGASALAMVDAMKIGGVTGWLRAAAIAQARSVPMSSHLFQEFSAHLLAVTPGADWLERLDIAGSILEPCVRFEAGLAHIPDRPGAGVVWREQEVARYRV